MTFGKFWEKLCDKQPGLKDPDGSSVTISVEAFENLLLKAFDSGAKNQKELFDLAKKLEKSNPFAGIFGL